MKRGATTLLWTLLVIYVPCYFGVKLGAGFATFLLALSIAPALSAQ